MSCNEFQGRFPLQTYFIFSFQRLVTASQRSVPASVPPDEVAELAVCRAATTISSASAAVNNHLRDKPLDLGGRGGSEKASGPKRVMRLMGVQARDATFVYMLPVSPRNRPV